MLDVLIIGGGIVGSSIAYRLSKYNLNTLLIEKNKDICQETTKANSAIIHGGYDALPGTLKAELNILGNSMIEKLSKDLGFKYKKIGSLVLAFNNDDLNVLEVLYKRGLENNVKGLKILDKNEVLNLEPNISSKVISALYCENAGIVDPFNYCYKLSEFATMNGTKIHRSEKVIDIKKADDFIEVTTDKSNYKSKIVINAAGLFADKIANLTGDYSFEIIPTKGVYRVLAKGESRKLNKILFQTPSNLGKGVLITPTYAGNVLVGPTSEVLTWENIEEDESLDQIDKLSRKSMPSINLNNTIRTFTGIRAKPSTGDFLIYNSRKLNGFINVAGIESPGLSSAPGIALYVEDLINKLGLVNLEKKSNYIGSLAKIKNILPEDNIICKCENVKESKIIEAIYSNVGARTVDGIKRRVRPGMGYCQGRRCRSKVVDILSRELNMDKKDLDIRDDNGVEIGKKLLKK